MIVSGCWIFCGVWIQVGNQMGWCDNFDLIGIGQMLNWVWVWLVNWWILYNCVLCDVVGKLFDLICKLIGWNGSVWKGVDILDFKVDELFENGMGLFIMNLEGVVCFFVCVGMNEGLFFEYYELFEMLFVVNLLYLNNLQVLNNLVVCVFLDDCVLFGKVVEFLYVVIMYWLIEYFYYWIKYVWLNLIIQFE